MIKININNGESVQIVSPTIVLTVTGEGDVMFGKRKNIADLFSETTKVKAGKQGLCKHGHNVLAHPSCFLKEKSFKPMVRKPGASFHKKPRTTAYPNANMGWSKEDKEILRENYRRNVPIANIASMLGRRKRPIISMIYKMRLLKPERTGNGSE